VATPVLAAASSAGGTGSTFPVLKGFAPGLWYVDIYAESPVVCLACAGFHVRLPAATVGVVKGAENHAAHVWSLAPDNVPTALAPLSAVMNAL